MINPFILLALPNLVVTPKITFQLHVVYGEEAKIYLNKIGFSGSQRGDTRLTGRNQKAENQNAENQKAENQKAENHLAEIIWPKIIWPKINSPKINSPKIISPKI